MKMNLFSPVEIDPVRFAALSPVLKTEALQLMAEAGYRFAAVAAATGLDAGEMSAIGSQRHQVRAFEFERSAENTPGIKRAPRLSPAARMLLDYMGHHCGVLAESVTSVAYDLGVSEKSAKAALQQLSTWAFIEKTRAGTGRVAAHYRLTPSGAALMAPAAEGDADE